MSNAPQLQTVLDRIDADFDNSLERLFALLRIKSISADPTFAGDCKQAADHLASDIATLGFATEVRPTAGHPAIVAKSNGGNGRGQRPHVLFYGHYDVQPVDPLNLWHRPPFEPAVTDHADGRKIIVARGAEDDKGQLMTFVEACRAWKSVTGSLPVDVTIVIEGEEEIGSKNFVPFLEQNKDELKADFALVCDTSMWDPNTPAITTSLRGLVYEEVKIKAANRDLHSGIFGGGARNPIRVLTQILGGLFDEDGHITIPGFYDGVKDLPPEIHASTEGGQPYVCSSDRKLLETFLEGKAPANDEYGLEKVEKLPPDTKAVPCSVPYYKTLTLHSKIELTGDEMTDARVQIDSQGGMGLKSWVGILNFVFLEFYCFVILGVQFRYALVSGMAILLMFETAMLIAFGEDWQTLCYWTYHVVTLFILASGIGWWREFLLRKGYSESDVRKILGENTLRIMEAAERVSREMQGQPSVSN